MKLGQILATGTSVLQIKDGNSRYKVTRSAYPPKFGAPQNPFAAVGDEAAGASPEPPAAERAPAPETTSPVICEPARSPFMPQANPADPQLELAPVAPAVKTPAAVKRAAAGWLARLNPLNWFGGAPEPAGDRGPVQPELSLDTVRVVRNDLSDSDMEAVVRPSILRPGARVPAWKEPAPREGTTAQKLRRPRVSSQFGNGAGRQPG